jgi:hypothetical protein
MRWLVEDFPYISVLQRKPAVMAMPAQEIGVTEAYSSASTMDDSHSVPIGGGMDAQTYLRERVDDQIDWYDRKSAFNKRWFISLRAIEITSAATVPFLSGFASNLWISVAVGVIGIVITLCAGITHLCQFQEHWIEYRMTAEALKKERFLFATKTDPYNSENAFSFLVQRVENLASKEVGSWAQYLTQPEKQKQNEHPSGNNAQQPTTSAAG